MCLTANLAEVYHEYHGPEWVEGDLLKRLPVKAVWDSDLRTLLDSLGMLEDLIEGNLLCAKCGTPVDFDNLGALFQYEGDIGVSCDESACVRAVTTPMSA